MYVAISCKICTYVRILYDKEPVYAVLRLYMHGLGVRIIKFDWLLRNRDLILIDPLLYSLDPYL